MQALLSFEQSPPLAASLRFFLTAPLFAILAGFLLLWCGPDGLASRWTPAVLALTHLIAVGFMLQVMLGAMLQILPVAAGANMARPLCVATVVHAVITLGVLCLVAAFLTFSSALFKFAAVLLGAGVGIFVVSAARAMYGIASPNSTIQGLKHALAGLAVSVGLGVWMTVSLGWSLDLPLLQLADIHLGWGFVAWGAVLLAAVAYVVVPMFQITPAYPGWFERCYSLSALAAVALWTIAEWLQLDIAMAVLGTVVVALAVLFAIVTLNIQRRSKRARFDASQHCWRVAMFSVLAAGALWLAARTLTVVGEWPAWPLLFGVLALCGGFMSVIIGMLYKIVPFLIWLHLQNQGQLGRVPAPNMKKIIAARDMDRQMRAHFSACALLLLAVWQPTVFVYPAAVALIVANGWLLRNLLSALAVHRAHQLKIEQLIGAR